MAVINRTQIKSGLLAFPLILSKSFAQKLDAGKSKVKFLFNFYSQEGSHGRQVYDGSGKEDVTAYEPMLFIKHQIDKDTNLNANIVFDVFSNASDTKLDAGTGASGSEGIGWQTRYSANLGASHFFKKHGLWNLNFGFSKEYDYRSFNLTLGTQQLYAQDNFTLAVVGQIFQDETTLMDVRNGVQIEGKHKNIYSFSITGTQLLTPDDILVAGVDSIKSSGAMEGISNTVDVAGTRYAERLPENRSRQSISTKLIHSINDNYAAHFKYRYYSDDWDIYSHTAQASLFKSFNDENDFIEISYRIYNQEGTRYYQDSFNDPVIFMTSDSDLQDYLANRIGVHYEKKLDDKNYYKINFSDIYFVAAAYYYTRDNHLNYSVIQTSLSTSF